MNTLIISALKKRLILVERYYRNLSKYNKETLLNQANECTKLITEAKQNYITKMGSKLDCPNTASKSYRSIINRFLNKKNSYVIFIKKLKYLIDTLQNNAL